MGRIQLHWSRKTVLVFLCVLATAASAGFFAVYLAKPETGLVVNFPETIMEGGRVLYAPKTPFSPAASGGLLPGRDALLSVAGMEIHSTWDVVRADAALWSFQPFPVRILRDGAQELTVTLTPIFSVTRLDWILVLLLAASLGFTAFAMAIWVPEEPATVFMVMACLTYLLFTCVKPFYYVSLAANAVVQAGRFSAWFLVLYALWFPRPRGRRAVRIFFLTVLLALLLAFGVARLRLYALWTATGAERWLDRYRALGQIGNVSDAVAYLCFAALLVLSYARTKIGDDRKRIEWILAGLLLALPPYFFLDQLPIILGQPASMRIGLGNLSGFFLLFLPLFVAIGILGRRVLDIRYLAVRYLVYGVLLAVVFCFFTLLAVPLRRILSSWYSLTPALAEILSSSILFMFLVPLRALLIRLTDRVFWREAYRVSPAYVRELENRNAQLALLLDHGGRAGGWDAGRRLLDDLRGIVHGISNRSTGSSEAGRSMRKLSELVEGELHAVPSVQRCRALLDAAAARIRRGHPRAVVLAEGDGEAAVFCRPEELATALEKVMENAVEACGDRTEVVGAQIARHDGTVEIEIRDRGAGFDPRMRQGAFRPFVSSKEGHDGLGLFVARVLTEANAGTLEVLPPADGGARVLFRFPASGTG